MEIEQPNPYKELRKELRKAYWDLGKTMNKVDVILGRLIEETK